MIVPPGVAGVAFSQVSDGDVRNDPLARSRLSDRLSVPEGWAWVAQMHGATVLKASGPGRLGEADAVWTMTPELPIAVFTADCLGIVVQAEGAVGVAHAGWKGTRLEVVRHLVEAMSAGGRDPIRAYIGPGIGPCCFEVGPEVAERFENHLATTTWGTTSVDLGSAVSSQLDGVEVNVIDACTRHDDRFFSHRRDATTKRQVTLGWLP